MKSYPSLLALGVFSVLGLSAVTAQPTGTMPSPTATSADVGTPSSSPSPQGATQPQGTPSSTPGLSDKASSRDRGYLVVASQSGMAQVQMSQLALKKSHNRAVRDFAQKMVKEHSDLNSQLTPMATQRGVSLPSAISASDRSTYGRLNRLSGSAFDRSYKIVQVGAQDKTLTLFQLAGTQADDPKLRTFFSVHVPDIQSNLQQIRSLR